MLSRAIGRTARLPALRRTAISTTYTPRIAAPASTPWIRGMANQNRPRKSPTSQPADQQQPSRQEPAPSRPDTPKSAAENPFEPTEPSGPTPGTGPPLPDLTQGIPSTLEYETAGATKQSELAALEKDEEAETESGGGRGRRELPASAYISSTERRRMKFANRMYAASAAGALVALLYLGREWDEEEAAAHADIPGGWSPGLWWKRLATRASSWTSYYREPAFEKLLPDPDPMFERPYTLCISLEDMLVHSEWTREHGWRVAKRPGVDYFLRYLSQYYELVLFTSVPFAMGEPLMRKLDPFRFIVWPLFREATKYKDGEIVKDLSYLNRDLSKVIILDTKASHVQNQPENAIVLPKWTGDVRDKDLVSLIPFLEYIHTMQYKDVREVLRSFEGQHIPTEFARREALARAQFNKQVEAERGRKPRASQRSGLGALGAALGLKPGAMAMTVPADPNEQSPAEAFAQGKMLQDIARERGQRNYEMMEREIQANGEKWLKEEQLAAEKMNAEAMSSMKSSFKGWFLPASKESPPPESEPEVAKK